EQSREWLKRNYQKPDVKAGFMRRTREYRHRMKMEIDN
ncbi:hypothetical protein LCGC14_2053560, partial [marine sediment metagenome]